jgi:hypothetical protein
MVELWTANTNLATSKILRTELAARTRILVRLTMTRLMGDAFMIGFSVSCISLRFLLLKEETTSATWLAMSSIDLRHYMPSDFGYARSN